MQKGTLVPQLVDLKAACGDDKLEVLLGTFGVRCIADLGGLEDAGEEPTEAATQLEPPKNLSRSASTPKHCDDEHGDLFGEEEDDENACPQVTCILISPCNFSNWVVFNASVHMLMILS